MEAIACAAGPIRLVRTCPGLLFGDCGVGDVAADGLPDIVAAKRCHVLGTGGVART